MSTRSDLKDTTIAAIAPELDALAAEAMAEWKVPAAPAGVNAVPSILINRQGDPRRLAGCRGSAHAQDPFSAALPAAALSGRDVLDRPPRRLSRRIPPRLNRHRRRTRVPSVERHVHRPPRGNGRVGRISASVIRRFARGRPAGYAYANPPYCLAGITPPWLSAPPAPSPSRACRDRAGFRARRARPGPASAA